MGCRTQATRAVARQATRQVAWRSRRRPGFRERGAGLRAFGFADISTSQQGRCRSWMRLRHLRVFFAARPGARPSPPRWLRSALLGEPRRQRLAPPGAARSQEMLMPSRRESCQQTRRARGRARSARVVAIQPTWTASSPRCWRWLPIPAARIRGAVTRRLESRGRRSEHVSDETGGDLLAGIDGGASDAGA
jgi:hypothetical protein